MDLTYEQLIEDMKSCEQTKGMSVLEHGQLVNHYYIDLMDHLRCGEQLQYQWKLPEWVRQYEELIMNKLYDSETMKRYQIHHDCGKPYCKTVDEEGKSHFPDHANVSYEVWNQLYPQDTVVSELIKMDMDFHSLKSEDLHEFSINSHAISLMITGLCEVHANASMFGGIDSTSFKIKWKHIDKKGRQVLSKISELS